MTPETKQAIVRDYLDGASLAAIGRKYYYHKTTVNYHLKKMGIRRPAGKGNHEVHLR